ncbi:MAG: hypothetical protein FJ279_11185 [Planctomycetes bacterium]|nr:hypothetical protein [Planctomycetota bacterium]
MRGRSSAAQPARDSLQPRHSPYGEHGFKIPYAAWEVTGDEKYKRKMDQALECVLAALPLTEDPNGAIVHVQGGNGFADWFFNEYLCTALSAYYGTTADAKLAERYLATLDFIFGKASDITFTSERYAAAYFMSRNPAFAKAASANLAYYASSFPFTGDMQRGSFTEAYRLSNHHTACAYLMAAVFDAKITPPHALPAEARPQKEPSLVSTQVVKPAEGYAFLPIDLSPVVNAAPLAADPFAVRAGVKQAKPEPSIKLKPGEIGFDFGFQGDCAAGFLPVSACHVYPATKDQPYLAGNFAGYPWGSVSEFNGIPFRLSPAFGEADKAMVVLRKGERVRVQVGRSARAVHFLGQVCGKRSALSDEGARYVLNFADGTSQEVPLRNMAHYQPFSLNPHYATDATLARRVSGFHGPGSALSVLTVQTPEKEIRSIDSIETGAGHLPALLGITLETKPFVVGESSPGGTPLLAHYKAAFDQTFTFKAVEPFDEAKGFGWLSPDNRKPITDNLAFTSPCIVGHGAATFAVRVPNGLYDVTLDVAGRNAEDYLSVDLESEPRLSFARPLSGLRTTVSASVTDGRLDITLKARTGAVPADYGRWLLKSIRVKSAVAPITPPPHRPITPSIVYGWQPETTGAQSKLMYTVRYLGNYHVAPEKDKLLGDCVACGYDWGPDDITFNVDLPNGSYEADCYVIQRYGGTPLVLDGFAEGVHLVKSLKLKDNPGGTWGQTRKVTMKADVKDGQLNLRFALADPKCKSKSYTWGIQAIVVRPLRD